MIGKCVNLYIRQEDIDKITADLRERGFLFVADEITEKPEPVYTPIIFTAEGWWAHYVVLPDTHLDYHSWEENGKMKYRVSGADMEAIEPRIGGYLEEDELFFFSFYYCPTYVKNGEILDKNPAFGKMVDEFFEWLKTEFSSVPHSPEFYHNPDFPISENAYIKY